MHALMDFFELVLVFIFPKIPNTLVCSVRAYMRAQRNAKGNEEKLHGVKKTCCEHILELAQNLYLLTVPS